MGWGVFVLCCGPPARAQVLGDMAQRGWDGLLVPLVRFWEGERSRERILMGVTDRNERDLLEYVYDTYFAPLLGHTPVALDPLAMADAFCRKHKVRPPRIEPQAGAARGPKAAS